MSDALRPNLLPMLRSQSLSFFHCEILLIHHSRDGSIVNSWLENLGGRMRTPQAKGDAASAHLVKRLMILYEGCLEHPEGSTGLQSLTEVQ